MRTKARSDQNKWPKLLFIDDDDDDDVRVPSGIWYAQHQIMIHTFSQANNTGAVARPNFKSAAVGFPIASDDETKSKRSSTN